MALDLKAILAEAARRTAQAQKPALPSSEDLPAVGGPVDRYIVAFSGGKDSTALVLHLLEIGVPASQIELWHHAIDPEHAPFMDWPVTPAYVRAFADEFGLPLYFQWKEGGFEREMLREGTPTAPTSFETPSGTVIQARSGRAEPGTRLKFPQKTADLSQRWCSAYLKIDVAAKVFTNDPRFIGDPKRPLRLVMLTGERGEESPGRAKYAMLEEHKATAPSKGRYVWQWRPILRWSEEDVWAIFARWRVVPHPAYRLGFGRLSCLSCIFGGPAQWATIAAYAPKHFEKVAGYEERFGVTIDRTRGIRELAARAEPFVPKGLDAEARHWMTTAVYDGPILLPRGQTWTLPAGAYKKTGGPV